MSDPQRPNPADSLRRAMQMLERLEARLAAERARARAPIAIVGAACRLPGGVRDLDGLAALLDEERDAVVEAPGGRWTPSPDPLPGERWAALLAPGEVERFDPDLFGISRREAARMDPQQRLALELAREAIEDAGLNPERLQGSRTGVFLGCSTHDNLLRLVGAGDIDDPLDSVGNMQSVLAGRVSFALGLQGPALVVDTACSSALVALHLACQSLRAGECQRALVGGVSLLLSGVSFRAMALTSALSPDGRCATFDARANGYVRGEGGAVLMLRPLDEALADDDRVLGVIRGSAVNQDGRSTGMTAPNVLAQAELYREALARAGVDAASAGLVEAHGTGTPLGDPIEIEGLRAALGEVEGPPLWVGSLKTNIGHLEAAAGVAGLCKVLVSLREGRVYRHLHLRTLNPRVRLEGSRLRVADRARPWPRGQTPRRALVSAFGMSGTNATVIVEEAPLPPAAPDPRPARPALLLPLSATHGQPLAEHGRRLAAWIEAHPEVALDDVSASLIHGRAGLSARAAVVARERGEALAALAALAEGAEAPGLTRGRALEGGASTGWLFTGQGAQRAGAGAGLYAAWPAFAEVVDRCVGAVGPWLREVLFGPDDGAIHQTARTQPALYTLEVALAALWRSWGFTPAALLGHSVGGVAAAAVAGVFSIEDGARLVAARGRLMQALPAGGGMLALRAPGERVEAALAPYAGRLAVAAFNGPDQTVVSGERAALDALEAALRAEGVRGVRLQVSHAFHSPLMEPMLDAFREALAGLAFSAPRLPLISEVHGALAGEEVAGAEYWVRHARAAVRFTEGVRALHALGVGRYLELGPGAVLVKPAARSVPDEGQRWVASLREGADETRAMTEAAASLWTAGEPLDPAAWLGPWRGARVPLPTTPARAERFPLVPDVSASAPSGPRWPLAGRLTRSPDGAVVARLPLSVEAFPALADHVIHGRVVVPGAFHLAALLAVGEELLGGGGLEVTDLAFVQALVLDGPATLALHLSPAGPERYVVALRSEAEEGRRAEQLHVTARLGRAQGAAAEPVTLPGAEATRVSADEVYAVMAARSVRWGPRWQAVEEMLRAEPVGGARLTAVAPMGGPVEPLHIDMAFATSWASLPLDPEVDAPPWLPATIDRIIYHGPLSGPAIVRALGRSLAPDERRGDLQLADAQGRVALSVEGFCVRHVPLEAILRALRPVPRGALHTLSWVPAAPRVSPSAPGLRLVLHDGEGLGPALVAALQARGVAARGLGAGELDLTDEGAVAAALAGVDALIWARFGGADPERAVAELLAAARALLAAPAAPQVTWLTAGATAEAPGEAGVVAAARLGFLRALWAEAPGRAGRRVDLLGEPAAERVLAALDGPEPELRLGPEGLQSPRLVPAAIPPDGAPAVDGPVLVTGGLGGLGRRVARWLVGHGARRLVLVGRSAPGPEARALVEDLRREGAEIELAGVDLRDAEACAELVSRLAGEGLVGVWHCAGVLDDAPIGALDRARAAGVLDAKLGGALRLHALTRAAPLQDFVLFSSLAGVTGNAGQAPYAAANAALDALAAHRRALGLPGVSVAWGAWEGEGMAAGLGARVKARMAAAGLAPLGEVEGLRALELALGAGAPPLVVFPFTPPADPGAEVHPLLAHRLPARRQEAPGPRALGADAVIAEVAAVLGTPPAELPLRRPLSELGLDSLMAVELRDRLARLTGEALPATLVYDHPTAEALAQHLAREAAVASAVHVAAAADEPVALIGLSLRLPGDVQDLDSLRRALMLRRSMARRTPADRFPIGAWLDPSGTWGITSDQGCFIDGFQQLDPGALSLSEAEAAALDPQQRLLLECGVEALEHAGLAFDRLDGVAAGVYMGLSSSDFRDVYGARDGERFSVLGNMPSVAAGRLAYTLGLGGPAVAVDTACSSALTAVHQAVMALRSGEVSLALAGGVNLILSPLASLFLSRTGATSPRGRCAPFSAEADGFGRGEGAGVFVLKRLSDARRDGDRVLAVILASCSNQDGRTNGLTAPSGEAQVALLRRAVAAAGLQPAEVDAVECHGTGTALGDPVELQALAEALGEGRPEDRPLRLTAAKATFNHLEAAAGVVGLARATLAVARRELVPDPPVARLNPHVAWERLPLRVQDHVEAWPEGQPLRVGVSAFGMSGTNVHLLLASPPEAAPRPAALPAPLPLLLSAFDAEALKARARAALDALDGGAPLLDLLATLANRRAALPVRAAIVAEDLAGLREGLAAAARGEDHPTLTRGAARGLAPRAEGGVAERARAWARGAAVDWSEHLPVDRLVDLPPYPWQRRRLWPERPRPEDLRPDGMRLSPGGAVGHPLLGRLEPLPQRAGQLRWRGGVSTRRLPALSQHLVGPTPVVPGMTWIDLALAVAGTLAGEGPVTLSRVRFHAMLTLADEQEVPLELRAAPEASGAWALEVRSGAEAQTLHAALLLSPGAPEGADAAPRVQGEGPALSGASLYARGAGGLVRYGPAFQGVREGRRGPGGLRARVALPPEAGPPGGHPAHPALLDACLQAGDLSHDLPTGGQVPVGVDRVVAFRPLPAEVDVEIYDLAVHPPSLSLAIRDDEGRVCLRVEGLRARALDASAPETLRWAVAWRPTEPPPRAPLRGPALLVEDAPGLAEGVAARLRAEGVRVRTLGPAEPPGPAIDAEPPALVALLAAPGDPVRAAERLLALVHAALRSGGRELPRLALVTRGAFSERPCPTQRALVGLARVVAAEHPELSLPRVDLPEGGDDEALLAELLAAGPPEEEVRVGAGRREVGRVAPAPDARVAPAFDAEGRRRLDFALVQPTPGVLDGLRMEARVAPRPGPGEVLVELDAVALNFRDVLLAMGMLDGLDLALGTEGVGRVVALGEGVEGLAPGDEVFGGIGGIGSHGVGRAATLFRRPPWLSPVEAAGVFTVWATAAWSLDEVARVRPGERVLIHSGAGGLGQAAIAWARHRGARVFATAGSEARRALAASLGAEAVADSRSEAFLPEVLAWTGGEGVDVVLNTLAGPLLEAGLAALAPHGRFVELGKRDVLGGGRVPLAPFLKGLSFTLVDLQQVTETRPRALRRVMEEVLDAMERGDVRPVPAEARPVSRAAAVFTEMAGGLHTGKRVLTLRDPEARVVEPRRAVELAPPGGAALITGGLGGLGRSLARHLAGRGVGGLVLLGRSAPDEADRQALAALGVPVLTLQADVGDRAALAAALASIPSSFPPIQTIYHAAGVLDDGLIEDLDGARLRRVFAPKLDGARHLAELSAGWPLDALVLFSSAAALLGSPGQGNYAAANAAMDALAARLSAEGVPAVSVQWGPIDEVGMAARTPGAAGGMPRLRPDEAWALLPELLGGPPEVAALRLDPRRLVEMSPQLAAAPRLAELVALGGGPRAAGGRLADALRALTPGEARARLGRWLGEQLAAALQVVEPPPGDRPFRELGVDSLIGLDLRNRLEDGLGLGLPTTLVWTWPTRDALLEHLAQALGLVEAPEAPEAPPSPPAAPDLSTLSDDELLAALADALE